MGEPRDLSEFDESLRHFEALPTLVANMKKGKFHGYTFVEPKKKEPHGDPPSPPKPHVEDNPPAERGSDDKLPSIHHKKREDSPAVDTAAKLAPIIPEKSGNPKASASSRSRERERGTVESTAHNRHARARGKSPTARKGEKREDGRKDRKDRRSRESDRSARHRDSGEEKTKRKEHRSSEKKSTDKERSGKERDKERDEQKRKALVKKSKHT